MSINPVNPYNLDPHIAELYDRLEHGSQDIELLQGLIGGGAPWRVLEPFCGTGRILVPLARDGHRVIGLDQSGHLLAGCQKKLALAGLAAELIEADATAGAWPEGFDLVVLGGNCLYELASPEEQEGCIRAAAAALRPGGYLFLDNDHMEGGLSPAWQDPAARPSFPTGECADGARLESSLQVVWFDAPARLARFRRRTRVLLPDGAAAEYEFVQQKHPVSAAEVRGWLEANGFVVVRLFGSRAGEPYTDASPRAIFWAKKR